MASTLLFGRTGPCDSEFMHQRILDSRRQPGRSMVYWEPGWAKEPLFTAGVQTFQPRCHGSGLSGRLWWADPSRAPSPHSHSTPSLLLSSEVPTVFGCQLQAFRAVRAWMPGQVSKYSVLGCFSASISLPATALLIAQQLEPPNSRWCEARCAISASRTHVLSLSISTLPPRWHHRFPIPLLFPVPESSCCYFD